MKSAQASTAVFIGCVLILASAETIRADINIISLEKSEQLALSQHPNMKLAIEEISVLKSKKDEAARSLWPNLTLKAEETHGEANRTTGTPDFKEKSYGVQATQTVLQGGKLYRTYQQSKALWESALAKREKIERDVVYNVRDAYWQMVRSRMALSIYEKALTDLEQEKRRAEDLFKKNIITKETNLLIQSQYQQAILSVESAEAEQEAQLWKWTLALGRETPPDFQPDSTLEVKISTITLKQCLRLAELNNPDLRIQQKSAEAAMYAHKAGRSNYWPKLSLNGFYGKSGGAYENEVFNLSEDWQVGLQLNQYFALNTLNLSALQQKTSPKIGQSTRTESKTGTASVNILDGYRQKSEIREAAFNHRQAEVQLNQLKIEIMAGVREAFANWKKGHTQLAFAENELEWKKTEFNIAKIKTAHRDIPVSERAKLRNELALAQAALIAAQTNFNVLQAALAKVIGVPDLFQY